MSDAPPRPRIEAEEMPAPRLEESLPAPLPAPPAPLVRTGTLSLALSGAAVLVLGLPALWVAGFVTDAFTRAPALGWTCLAVSVAGFGLIGAGIAGEIRGLFALRTVDRLRRDLASRESARIHAAARAWLAGLPDQESLLPALEAAAEPEAMLALLRAGPAAALRARADALARTASLQAAAAVAATPSPALDVLTFGWLGVRLVRQVAALHGMRPGLLATLALLRRTALAAASVAATELAVNAAAHAALSHPLLGRVLGDVAGAGVAARRMVVLARAASTACSPLPPA